jgi:hypothetical protein
MSTITNAPTPVDGKTLLPNDLFTRMEARISAEHPELSPEMPARILDQALAFLGACAVTTEPIGPSPIVDIGWHTFILHTIDYAAFCDRIAGRLIHHVPDDDRELGGNPTAGTGVCNGICRCVKSPARSLAEQGAESAFPGQTGLKATVLAIRAAGYRIDQDLWPASATAGDCTQCHAGCHDSPTRG